MRHSHRPSGLASIGMFSARSSTRRFAPILSRRDGSPSFWRSGVICSADEARTCASCSKASSARLRMTHERPCPIRRCRRLGTPSWPWSGLAHRFRPRVRLARYDWSIDGEIAASADWISSVIAMLNSASVMIGTNGPALEGIAVERDHVAEPRQRREHLGDDDADQRAAQLQPQSRDEERIAAGSITFQNVWLRLQAGAASPCRWPEYSSHRPARR